MEKRVPRQRPLAARGADPLLQARAGVTRFSRERPQHIEPRSSPCLMPLLFDVVGLLDLKSPWRCWSGRCAPRVRAVPIPLSALGSARPPTVGSLTTASPSNGARRTARFSRVAWVAERPLLARTRIQRRQPSVVSSARGRLLESVAVGKGAHHRSHRHPADDRPHDNGQAARAGGLPACQGWRQWCWAWGSVLGAACPP